MSGIDGLFSTRLRTGRDGSSAGRDQLVSIIIFTDIVVEPGANNVVRYIDFIRENGMIGFIN